MKRWSWLMAIATSIFTLAMIGCSGDDETTPTTTTTIVTNTVNGVTRTNVVVVTNAPADDPVVHPPIVEAPPADELAAPTLVAPANGQEYFAFNPALGYSVKFQWAAVPGADTYIFELDGALSNTDGISRTVTLTMGLHTWCVRAKKNGALISGPASETRTVNIRQKLFGG